MRSPLRQRHNYRAPRHPIGAAHACGGVSRDVNAPTLHTPPSASRESRVPSERVRDRAYPDDPSVVPSSGRFGCFVNRIRVRVALVHGCNFTTFIFPADHLPYPPDPPTTRAGRDRNPQAPTPGLRLRSFFVIDALYLRSNVISPHGRQPPWDLSSIAAAWQSPPPRVAHVQR